MAVRDFSYDLFGRREVIRWIGSFLIVLMAHGAAAYVFYADRDDEGEITASDTSSAVYYATLPMVDAPAREIQAGQEQVQTDAAPPPAEAKPEPMREVEPVSDPTPQKPSETKLEESQEEKPVVENPVPLKELPAIPDAAVTLPTAVPPPPAKKEVAEKKEQSEEKSDAQPAPPVATAPETTAPTSASVRSAAHETWRTRISAHLQRHKRYPHAAALRGEQGTTELTFSVDREGRIISAKIHRGSGHELLDGEAIAMIHRAQPLPRPPGEVGGREFIFTVPVRFKPK